MNIYFWNCFITVWFTLFVIQECPTLLTSPVHSDMLCSSPPFFPKVLRYSTSPLLLWKIQVSTCQKSFGKENINLVFTYIITTSIFAYHINFWLLSAIKKGDKCVHTFQVTMSDFYENQVSWSWKKKILRKAHISWSCCRWCRRIYWIRCANRGLGGFASLSLLKRRKWAREMKW